MNFSELLLSAEQFGLFIVSLILVFVIYYYLKSNLPYNNINIRPEILVILLYIIFIIVNRIVKTNISYNVPLTKYLLKKKNYREEPYHINYINPFVTNLDKIDFNMKKKQNKKYIKNILSQLLLRKYVNFQNVLGYIKNPWDVIKLETLNSNQNKYVLESGNIDITNNQYCMNYVNESVGFLLLYRKHILKFVSKKYFIFERKYKRNSKYYLNECISQVNVDSSTIDTRDLYYDRQYILFSDFPADDNRSFSEKYKDYMNEYTKYYWENDDDKIYDVIVLDIYFIYNQMMIMDENIYTKGNTSKQDYALNRFYKYQTWLEKKYYNFIINQFKHRINSSVNTKIKAENIKASINGSINDMLTIKIRKNVSEFLNYGTNFNDIIFDLKLQEKLQTSELVLKKKNTSGISINFISYIKDYIQGPPEKQANELVIIKNKNTKLYENNDTYIDKNTISYVSFDFLNIKNITEYKNKMNYLANSILDKYYKDKLESINKIKYNMNSLRIIELDNLYRYNNGKNRLKLNNKTITPNNINQIFNDINRLRLSYELFLEKTLKYKKTLNDKINSNDYSLNVTNNELLSILNYTPYEKKLNYLCKIKKIDTTKSKQITNSNNSHKIQLYDLSDNIVMFEIEDNTFAKQTDDILFLKFSTTINANGFNINRNNIYVVYTLAKNDTLDNTEIYIENYLLETDINDNVQKITAPKINYSFIKPISLYNCTNLFRKETIGMANLIKIIDKNTFKIIFDNVALEFKSLNTDDNDNNIYIEKPNYIMLSFSRNTNINLITQNIYENQLYKVIKVQSTSSTNSAELTVKSLIELTTTPSTDIFKNILVSQYINNNNYIKNVYFKKVLIPTKEKLLSGDPNHKFVLKLNQQIINITPEITRNDIIANYSETMNKIIDYIYKNEARKIHYEVPENIGIYLDKTTAIYKYKYSNELYIPYEKRNRPVANFKNYSTNFLCRKIYNGNNYILNKNELYFLDSFLEYYTYFLNLFKNTLGLYDDLNYQCTEYYKSGSMLSNLKLPISFNKYVSFSANYMLYYKKNIIVDDINETLLGKHIVLNNTVCDNNLLSVNNSNSQNSRLYKDFLKNFIYKHEIGRKGFEYDDAKQICERIFTVYDNNCLSKVYKTQPKNPSDYNLEYYKSNKARDDCFTVLYNDEKEKNTYEFIADSKILDPTNTSIEVTRLQDNLDKVKKLKNTCAAKLDKQSCNADTLCYYDINSCKTLAESDDPLICSDDGTILGRVIGIELLNKMDVNIYNIMPNTDQWQIYFTPKNIDLSKIKNLMGIKSDTTQAFTGVKLYHNSRELTGIAKNVTNTHFNKADKGTYYDSKNTGIGSWVTMDSSVPIIGVGTVQGAYEYLKTNHTTSTQTRGTSISRVTIPKYNGLYVDNNGYKISHTDKFTLEFEGSPYKYLKLKLAAKLLDNNINENSFIYIKNKDIVQNKIVKVDPSVFINDSGAILPDDINPSKNNITKPTGVSDNSYYKKYTSNNYRQFNLENALKYMLQIKYIYPDKDMIVVQPLSDWVEANPTPIIFNKNDKFYKSISTKDKPNDYIEVVNKIQSSGNLRFYPHRLAHLNEIKTAAYYGADWDSIGWINKTNPMLENKSNLVKIKDKKVMWIDPNDENAINKGVVCYGRKLDQNKVGADDKNELYNFQMEKIEQSIKDIRKYENVSDFTKNIYSRWNL